MGYHADLMAEINKIPREEQDEFAARSHKNASNALKAGKFEKEVVPVKVKKSGKIIDKDDLIRDSVDPQKISKLNPVFRSSQDKGTVTAATSSPLTDGASAVLIMSKSKAKELGYPTDIRMRCFINTAIDPYPQLLLAPALAIPKALDKAGLTLEDIDFFEFHEAFASQVLCTLKCLEDDQFCQKFCGKEKALGKIDRSKVNVNGG
jgi:acetyl-CoA acyltransferase